MGGGGRYCCPPRPRLWIEIFSGDEEEARVGDIAGILLHPLQAPAFFFRVCSAAGYLKKFEPLFSTSPRILIFSHPHMRNTKLDWKFYRVFPTTSFDLIYLVRIVTEKFENHFEGTLLKVKID